MLKMASEKANSVVETARSLGLKPALLYHWKKNYADRRRRPKNQNRIENEKLLIEIDQAFIQNRCEYRSAKIYRELRAVNNGCSENRVSRFMHLNCFVTVDKKKLCVTTNLKQNLLIWPNIWNRNFSVFASGKV